MSTIGVRPHDRALRELVCRFIADGKAVAAEVGIPGGRIDLVVIDSDGTWSSLFEVKLSAPMTAVAQLLDYSEFVGGNPDLTIVVPPALDSEKIRRLAGDNGIDVWAFAFDGLDWPYPAESDALVDLPYFHPLIAARMSHRARHPDVHVAA